MDFKSIIQIQNTVSSSADSIQKRKMINACDMTILKLKTIAVNYGYDPKNDSDLIWVESFLAGTI